MSDHDREGGFFGPIDPAEMAAAMEGLRRFVESPEVRRAGELVDKIVDALALARVNRSKDRRGVDASGYEPRFAVRRVVDFASVLAQTGGWPEDVDRPGRRRGRPNRTQDGRGLDTLILDWIWVACQAEWSAISGYSDFHPDFQGAEYEHREQSRLERMNPAARLFYLTARAIEPEYSIPNLQSKSRKMYRLQGGSKFQENE